MAELNRINNPNNTATFARRGTHVREMDNDGVSMKSADADYYGNFKKFARPAAPFEPNRDASPPKCR